MLQNDKYVSLTLHYCNKFIMTLQHVYTCTYKRHKPFLYNNTYCYVTTK